MLFLDIELEVDCAGAGGCYAELHRGGRSVWWYMCYKTRYGMTLTPSRRLYSGQISEHMYWERSMVWIDTRTEVQGPSWLGRTPRPVCYCVSFRITARRMAGRIRTDLTNLMADISVACTLMCRCCTWETLLGSSMMWGRWSWRVSALDCPKKAITMVNMLSDEIYKATRSKICSEQCVRMAICSEGRFK